MTRYEAFLLILLATASSGAALAPAQDVDFPPEVVGTSDIVTQGLPNRPPGASRRGIARSPAEVYGVTDIVTQGVYKDPRNPAFEIPPVDSRAAGNGKVSLRLRMSGKGVNSNAGVVGDVVLEFDNWFEAYRTLDRLAHQFEDQASRTQRLQRNSAQLLALDRWRAAEGRLATLKADLKNPPDAGNAPATARARQGILKEIQDTERESVEAREDYFPRNTISVPTESAADRFRNVTFRLDQLKSALKGMTEAAESEDNRESRDVIVREIVRLERQARELRLELLRRNLAQAENEVRGLPNAPPRSELQRSIDELRDQIQLLRTDVSAMRELLEKKQ